MIGAIRGSATPRAWWPARAGLVRGPRKLNTVSTPSSHAEVHGGVAHRRVEHGGEAKADVGLGQGGGHPRVARRWPPRAPPAGRRCRSGRRRPGCRAWPPAGGDTAQGGQLDTLKVPAVPAGAAGVEQRLEHLEGAAAASMALTRPVISVAVSPLMRRPVAKAAIWAGVASPPAPRPMAAPASSSLRSSRRRSGPSTAGREHVRHSELPGHVDAVGAKLIDSRNTSAPAPGRRARRARPVAGKHQARVRAAWWRAAAAWARSPSAAQAWASSRASWAAAAVAGGAGSWPARARSRASWKRPSASAREASAWTVQAVSSVWPAWRARRRSSVAVGLGRLPVAGVEVQLGERTDSRARGHQQPPAMGRSPAGPRAVAPRTAAGPARPGRAPPAAWPPRPRGAGQPPHARPRPARPLHPTARPAGRAPSPSTTASPNGSDPLGPWAVSGPGSARPAGGVSTIRRRPGARGTGGRRRPGGRGRSARPARGRGGRRRSSTAPT